MKKLIFAALLITLSLAGSGQGTSFNLNTGYAMYNLSDLKDFQKNITTSTPVNEKPITEFPNYIYYSLSADYIINDNNLIGLAIDYYYTGGRNQVIDYSGEYTLDMQLNGYVLSVQYSNKFTSIKKFLLYGRLRAGTIFSNLKLKEDFEIYNLNTWNDNIDLKSTGIVIEPSLIISYPVYKTFKLNICIGYNINLPSEIVSKENKDAKLSSNGNTVDLNWSGIRTTIGLTYTLWKK